MLPGIGLALLHGAAPTPGAPRMSASAVPWRPPARASFINEPEALWVLDRMQCAPVAVSTSELDATIRTTFVRPKPRPQSDAPVALFLHGADFSCLEWRFVIRGLNQRGFDCTAVDWWSGGWTDREPITSRLQEGDGPKPWTLVRQHLLAFWEQQLGGRPVILVGASLGGAVALDIASSHPEMVERLVLIDAGGQSYKAPPPDVTAALAKTALGVKGFFQGVQQLLPDDQSRIVSLHRAEPGCYEASLAYLSSGGIARRVDRKRIRKVAQPTLVLWGTNDDILPLEDAYGFKRDLQRCVGVKELEGCGHSPHLEDPATCVRHLADFFGS